MRLIFLGVSNSSSSTFVLIIKTQTRNSSLMDSINQNNGLMGYGITITSCEICFVDSIQTMSLKHSLV